MTDKLEESDEDIQLINVWTSYTVRDWTFAAEYNQSENAPAAVSLAAQGATSWPVKARAEGFVGAEAEGYLVMANRVWDRAGVTFRYSEYEVETDIGATIEDLKAFTIAPSYMVSENLLVILEYRRDEDNITNESTNTYALELLLTF